jgi:hypothetical protein
MSSANTLTRQTMEFGIFGPPMSRMSNTTAQCKHPNEGSRSTLLCIRSAPLRAFDLSRLPSLIANRHASRSAKPGSGAGTMFPPPPVQGAAGLPPDHPIPTRSLVVCLSRPSHLCLFSMQDSKVFRRLAHHLLPSSRELRLAQAVCCGTATSPPP